MLRAQAELEQARTAQLRTKQDVDQGAKTVYIVGPDNKVALRSVKLSGDRWESHSIVDERLNASC